jgi:hypothetical protein
MQVMDDIRLGRRAAGLGVLGLALPGLAVAAPAVKRFRVLRQGQAIGTHTVTIDRHGEVQEARTEVDVAIRMAGIVVYRFRQRLSERWRGGMLVQAQGFRERNGERFELLGRAEGGVIQVQGTAGRFTLPGHAAPLSWWNPSKLDRPLFGGDEGRILDLRVTHHKRPGGGDVFRTTGYEESEAVYDSHGTWIGWRTKAEDGSTVTYERL